MPSVRNSTRRKNNVCLLVALRYNTNKGGKEYSIGTSFKGKVRICKLRGGKLRHTLYMCALNAKKTNPAYKELFDRLVAKGKNKKLAIIAVCNKLLKQVFCSR